MEGTGGKAAAVGGQGRSGLRQGEERGREERGRSLRAGRSRAGRGPGELLLPPVTSALGQSDRETAVLQQRDQR